MKGLKELILEGEKILDKKTESEVKAIPIGYPMCIKHDYLAKIPEHEILDRAHENGANAYVLGNTRYGRGTTNFTPIQLYRILK